MPPCLAPSPPRTRRRFTSARARAPVQTKRTHITAAPKLKISVRPFSLQFIKLQNDRDLETVGVVRIEIAQRPHLRDRRSIFLAGDDVQRPAPRRRNKSFAAHEINRRLIETRHYKRQNVSTALKHAPDCARQH